MGQGSEVEVGRDWTEVKAVKRRLMQSLLATTPPGGVRLDATDEIEHKAALELVEENAGMLKIMCFSGTLTLMRSPDLDGAMTPEQMAFQRKSGMVIDTARLDQAKAYFDFLQRAKGYE